MIRNPHVSNAELVREYHSNDSWTKAFEVRVSRTADLTPSLDRIHGVIVNGIDVFFNSKGGKEQRREERLDRWQATALRDALTKALESTEGQEWDR